MAKPSDLPRWAETVAGTEDSNILEPNSGKKDTGYTTGGDVPSSSVLNWLLNRTYKWCKYLDGLTSEALTWAAKQTFGAGADVSGGDVTLTALSTQGYKKSGGIGQFGTTTDHDVQFLRNGSSVFEFGSSAADAKARKITNLAAPAAASNDAATANYVDAHSSLTSAHSAASVATPSRMVVRDANGRAQMADPSLDADIDTKGARNASFGIVKSADQSTTSDVLSNVDDLSFPVEANGVYEFELTLLGENVGTGDLKIKMTGPTLPTRYRWTVFVHDFTSSYRVWPFSRTLYTETAAIAGGGGPMGPDAIKVLGFLINGANAGTMQLQFRSGTSGQSVKIEQGSVLRYRKIG